MKKRIAIIGGGASGLFSALHAAIIREEMLKDVSITIFEGNREPARKLLITGSSQCNITHDSPIKEMIKHYHEHEKEVGIILNAYSPKETLRYFKSIGLQVTTREDGKIFPASFQSRDVLTALLRMCEKFNIEIQYQKRISSIERKDSLFTLYTQNSLVGTFDALIIATGGMTFPKTGSKGDGYLLASSLGHTLTPQKVGLSGIRVRDDDLHLLSGITLENVHVEIQKGIWKKGSLLITHDGLSGPVIINNSRYLTTGDSIQICYLNDAKGDRRSSKEVQKEITRLSESMNKNLFKTVLSSLPIPSSFIDYLLAKNNLDGKRKSSEVGKKSFQRIATALTQDSYIIDIANMESKGMITSGGINLDEVDLRTMQSTIIPHLYFCGEVIDIDGETGGYNLQLAWSTGAIAGKEAFKAL